MEFEKTSLEIYGVLIQEPMTTLTDLLVSGVCFYAFSILHPTNRSTTLLKYYFLTMAMATGYSAIFGHALLHYVGFEWKIPGWLMSMFSVALIERTSITHAKPILSERLGKFLTLLNGIELMVLIIIVLATLNFKFVEVHAAYGLLVVVFSLELYIFKNTRAESSLLFIVATGISAMAGAVHLSQFTIHTWFNYLDLSHVLMAIAAYVFLLGGRKLESAPYLPIRFANDDLRRVSHSSHGIKS